MSGIRIAARYAKSLLDLANEQGKLDRTVDDIKLFLDAVDHRDLYLMIKSPIINLDKKRSVFKALFENKVDELTASFFDIVIKKGREAYLPEISKEYLNQYKKLKNITSAHVTTAEAMDDAQMAKIKAEMKRLGLATGEVELTTKIDPEIIGGFVLQVEDRLYDASVKSKLTKLKKEVLDNSYIKSL
jgi:ATP synthase, F1 delta subunit